MEVKRSIITKYKLSLPMIIFSGILFLILAWKMDANAGPDEIYRWLVAEWIANNGKLPTGFELDIVNPVWCYSYAFTPYLPSMIAGIFVKIAMVFTSNAQVLLFAARLISIISGMGTIYVAFRVGDKLMDNKYSVYFFAGIVAYLPQFTFLSSYLNNDVLSVLTSFMILDAVLEGLRSGWNTKNMVYLASGTGLCMLTYYFGYGWVLFAVAGYFYTAFRVETSRKDVFRKAGIIALLVFAVAGWYFIRNGIIYKGDFLGYRAQQECADYYSVYYAIFPVNNPGGWSMGLRDMLHNGRWVSTTVESFIGVFGGMIICLDGKFYDFYLTVFWACVLVFTLRRYKTRKKISTPMLLMLLVTAAFPVVFSIYSSFARDYQPQGRYVITVLPVICVLCGVGMDEFSKAVTEKFEGKKSALARFGKFVPAIAATGLFLMFIVIFYTVILPTLTFIYLPGADKVMFYYVR